MAAPTQAYPPWLTPSPAVETNVAGEATATATSVVYLPLTYYGPSIPLGNLWVFGGSTSPASTATTVPSSAIPTTSPLTTSATPTSTSSVSSISSPLSTLPLVYFSSSQASYSSSSTSSSVSPTSSVAPVSRHHLGLTKGELIGIVIATILGVIFLFVLGLAIYLCCKDRKRRSARNRLSLIVPIDEDYFVVGPGGHSPGEGSPRHSGEEFDPFLQRSGTKMGQVNNDMVTRLGGPPPQLGSLSSKNSSSSNTSGYGVLLDRPSMGLLPSMAEVDEGHPSTSNETQHRTMLPHVPEGPDGEVDESGALLLPPPRLVDSVAAVRPGDRAHDSLVSHRSSYPVDGDEAATFLTARRVKVDNVIPRPISSSHSNRLSTGLFGLGLGLANFGRLSWFKSDDVVQDSRPSSTVMPANFSQYDIEYGQPQKPWHRTAGSHSSRDFGVGLGKDGKRPASNVSGTSGATVYHDAPSSLPPTPVLSSPPRALAPSHPLPPLPDGVNDWSVSTSYLKQPMYDDRIFFEAPARPQFGQAKTDVDILDMPAPSAVSPFASSSHSLRDSISLNSSQKKAMPFPPGLDMMTVKTWTDTLSSGTTRSPPDDSSTSIDVLEDAPPSAAEPWRSIAGGGPADFSRRMELESHSRPLDLMSGLDSSDSPDLASPSTELSTSTRPRPHTPPLSHIVDRLPSAHVSSPERTGAGGDAYEPKSRRETKSPVGESLSFQKAPWVGGLDHDWHPA